MSGNRFRKTRGVYRRWVGGLIALTAAFTLAGGTLAQSDVERMFWDSVTGCTSALEVRAYVEQFPSGHFVGEANTCLGRLENAAAPRAVPKSWAADDFRKGLEAFERKDHAEAARWYRKAADQGFAAAPTNLGYMLGAGRGVARDEAEAVRWYRKAADQGFAAAQTNLGTMLEAGRGVARDEAEAIAWYCKAAAQGDPNVHRALNRLGAQ